MKLFKKYGLALVLTVAMILLALVIGQPQAPKAENPDYYSRWISDEAGLLSAAAEQAVCGYNEQLDQKYGSIVGLITVDSWGGADPEDFTYDLAEEMGFGEWDFVLALCKNDRDFYFAFGAESGYYANASLESTVIRHMTNDVYGSGADSILPALYADLVKWYGDNIPDGTAAAQSRSGDGGFAFAGVAALIVFLLFVAFIVVLISALSRASFGGGTYIPVGTPWYSRPYRYRRYTPPPPPPPVGGVHRPNPSRPVNSGSFGGSSRLSGFGGTTRSSSRGFGGSSRGGSFGSGPRGGFGGSSRGGGFGGKR